ncbi:MAG TPA: 30S ribosomal protein S8 [Armatimonadota bacterium]|nr:30S ribosomal protein S8 [Armatimonadota bacterium]HOM71246.1 30S ribosomal protein S8 [Armatimonadota bacterium]HOP79825.1 30S ribosomal protein S8 [Armatimonadota bacterium]HPP74565.1 30S ribosomal protein S8 [Armatimonadota bacterium]
MSVTDPVADLLTRIRNANAANHDNVEAPASKLNIEIVKILQSEGFIKGYEMVKDAKFPTIRIHLKYGSKREKVITNLRRISKPGLRVYTKRQEVPRVLRGLGIAIISTSKGVMTDREARRLGVGGEVLCYVW